MTLRVKDVTVTAEGRDKGKVFRITEMPASYAERWAFRAFLALTRSGVDIPDDIRAMGMAGIAVLGLKALSGVKFEEAIVLLDEMFSCIKRLPDPHKPDYVRDLVEGVESDTEEVMTRLMLRREVFELHTGFSLPGNLSASAKPPTPESLPGTPTRQHRSAR